MSATKDLGLVLRRLDYSETSQVLAVFCRETGQQRLIAKGIKRGTKTRVAVGIDLLELGHVVFSRRPGSEAQLGTLTEWRQEETFPHLRQMLVALYAAQYAADRTAQATLDGDPHPLLFEALLALLRSLGGVPPLSALTAFLWTLLREIGLMPELRRCGGCTAALERIEPRRVWYFSARQGGLLCRDCEPAHVEKRRVDPAGLTALWRVADAANDDASSATAPDDGPDLLAGFDLLDYHLTETLAKPSRVGALLRGALPRAPGSRA